MSGQSYSTTIFYHFTALSQTLVNIFIWYGFSSNTTKDQIYVHLMIFRYRPGSKTAMS
jgi:hypothetical protein